MMHQFKLSQKQNTFRQRITRHGFESKKKTGKPDHFEQIVRVRKKPEQIVKDETLKHES